MPNAGVTVSWDDGSGFDERPRSRAPRNVAAEEHEGREISSTASSYDRRPRPTAAGADGPAGREARIAAAGGVPGRRTVMIRGQGTERDRAPSSRRRPERRHEREGFRPDRAAMWAVLLGVMLILVAVTSAHAAMF